MFSFLSPSIIMKVIKKNYKSNGVTFTYWYQVKNIENVMLIEYVCNGIDLCRLLLLCVD